MALTSLLDKSVILQTATYTKDAAGGIVATFAGTTSYPCAVWPASAKTVADFARRDMLAEYEIATEIDIHATAGDRLVVDGRTYTAIGYERFENASLSVPDIYITITGLRNQ